MATPDHMVFEDLKARPHDVALPYRGDGVARALCDAFLPESAAIPPDMIMLLAAIDDMSLPTDPRSKP